MALRYASVDLAGTVSESLNNQASLISTAITANAGAGAKADVSSNLAAISANQPTGSVVVSVDLSAVTTRNKLKQLLDAALNHFFATNNVT